LPPPGKTVWELIAEQFEDLLVRILLLAACISFVSQQVLLFILVSSVTLTSGYSSHVHFKLK